ncbi:Stk1 family PASTA domain-containing Ser/Thr kinase [Staphylococcus sp. SQ8-PEA]|uniref:non-specific serine/threonine protein kinase n=1 Tax=Staphylococcus marylandisciuri TaxID=2981529 RepID=A0ABT2QP51_9STAP|nr:Stk1 family PASTA domain-containing Ser/Thr kinase [Staphylococcus marylandisciuri]MCU5745751.1 Stk1 family PASTA domain-containing Ser/Thr kinase [Staphylococcus marylandisciuri]
MMGHYVNERYRITKKLGGGGMSTVYLAEDTILNRSVAVKAIAVSAGEKEEILQRFQKEVHNLTQLSHPNIVDVYDIDEGEDDNFYIVMEYLEGPTLNDFIRAHHPLDVPTIINFTHQILEGIEHAHAHQIVHRDIKPHNILITKDKKLKILDFGIAKALSETAKTETNSVLGTVQYLSPEQARGERTDKATDIYSIGIVLYEMLLGKPPFTGETAISVALQHIQSSVPNPTEQREEIPQSLSNVVLRATEKNKNDRYPTIEAMREDLNSCLNQTRQNEEVYHTDNTQTKTVPIQTDKIVENFNRDTKVMTQDNDQSSLSAEDRPNHQHFQSDESQFYAIPAKKRSRKKKIFLAFIFLLLLAALIGFVIWGMFGNKYSEAPDVSHKTQNEAERLLKNKKLKTGRIQHEYSDKVEEGKVIRTDPKIGSRVKQGSKVNLVLSKGPKMSEMPSLFNMTKESAKDHLEKLGFTDVEIDQAYTKSNIAKGHIEDQSIEPGKKVKIHGTHIKLTESLGVKQVKVGDYEGDDVKEATKELQQKGFNVTITKKQYDDEIEKNHIISQTPKNKKVDEGSTVQLIISRGAKKEDKAEKHDDNKDTDSEHESKDKKSESRTTAQDSEDEKSVKEHDATVEIPYSDKNGKRQKVEIIKRDSNYTGDSPYKTYSISSDKEVTIPLEIEKGHDAGYTVRVDNKIVADKDIDYDDA